MNEPTMNPEELPEHEILQPVKLSPPDPATALFSEMDSGQYIPPAFVPAPTVQPQKRQNGMLMTSLAVTTVLLAGVAGFGGAALYDALNPNALSQSAGNNTFTINNPDEVNLVSAVAAKAGPSVVTLEVSAGNSAGTGSGVILSADGYVLTNNHVVTFDREKAEPRVTVKAANGKLYVAKIVATDPIMDLAVVKLENAAGLQPIEFADSSMLNVGDKAIAIGAPLGLEGTVTEGIISALNRSINVSAPLPADNNSSDQNNSDDDDSSGEWFWNNVPRLNQGSSEQPLSLPVIQTDASINPGNSGGALLNAQGQLIGINVAIATPNGSQGTAGSIGVGFAIPSNLAKRVADELIEFEKASHGLLGASVRTALPEDSREGVAGAYIAEVVNGSAADKAGLKAGDVVTKFNNISIGTSSDLTAQVRYLAGGSNATLTYSRDGRTGTAEVTLGELEQ